MRNQFDIICLQINDYLHDQGLKKIFGDIINDDEIPTEIHNSLKSSIIRTKEKGNQSSENEKDYDECWQSVESAGKDNQDSSENMLSGKYEPIDCYKIISGKCDSLHHLYEQNEKLAESDHDNMKLMKKFYQSNSTNIFFDQKKCKDLLKDFVHFQLTVDKALEIKKILLEYLPASDISPLGSRTPDLVDALFDSIDEKLGTKIFELLLKTKSLTSSETENFQNPAEDESKSDDDSQGSSSQLSLRNHTSEVDYFFLSKEEIESITKHLLLFIYANNLIDPRDPLKPLFGKDSCFDCCDARTPKFFNVIMLHKHELAALCYESIMQSLVPSENISIPDLKDILKSQAPSDHNPPPRRYHSHGRK